MTKGEEIVAAIIERLSVISLVANVFDDREQNLDVTEVPAIVVRERGDSTVFSPTQRTYIVTTKIGVEIIVQGRDKHESQDDTEPAITQIRAIQEEVENILFHEWETLGGLIFRLVYTGATVGAANNGQLTTKSRTLNFDAEWHRDVFRNA